MISTYIAIVIIINFPTIATAPNNRKWYITPDVHDNPKIHFMLREAKIFS
jgi:hypothetical protein